MATFLGKSLTKEQLEKLAEYLQFDNMAKNASVNREFLKSFGSVNNDGKFIRKGISFWLIFEPTLYELISADNSRKDGRLEKPRQPGIE